MEASRNPADRFTEKLERRLTASEVLGRDVDFHIPEHYEGPYADASPEALELERYVLELRGDLPGDLDPCHCTTGAWYLRKEFSGIEIQGFLEGENPEARTAWLAGGHDFAVKDGRYIIDPWAVDSLPSDEGAARKYVHDLQDPRDAREIDRLYGDQAAWTSISEFDSPRYREYGDYDDETLVDLAAHGKPGAFNELERRGLSLPEDFEIKGERCIYLAQCDVFRRRYDGGEEAWHEMMAKKEPVSATEFKAMCDASALLDDDETLEDRMAEYPDAGYYRSEVAGLPCYFLQHAGFEFIFLRESDSKRLIRLEQEKRTRILR